MENLLSLMEEKSREQKRARTVRTEYNRGKDVLQSWLQQAELKVQDKTSQPQIIKEALQHIQAELPAMQDKLEQVSQNGKIICENSNDPNEVAMITDNVNTLTEQITMIRAWIDEKKQQVGDSLDSWERFMTLYNTVLNWVHERREFLKLPLHLANLEQAKSKLHDYNGAVKSCKNMGKVLSEMSKELNHISENGSIGDLSEKMEEAETAKAEVESQLLERNALLHEATEEWEQCEKKLREVRAWINKTKGGLDQGAGKKKPLRDQLATKEKVMADITIQKTKISVSIEKLQVHFKKSLAGGEGVIETGEEMKKELDGLHGVVRQQSVELEEAINQVEQYQQELLQLKQEVVESEQKLRTISSPTYMPNDRDTVMKEQVELKNSIHQKRDKISYLIKMVRNHNPVWPNLIEIILFIENDTFDVIIPQGGGGDRLSYADVTAGRISPCPQLQGGSRNASPVHTDRSHQSTYQYNISTKMTNEFIKKEQMLITSAIPRKGIEISGNNQVENITSEDNEKIFIPLDDISCKTPDIQISVVEAEPTRRLSRYDEFRKTTDNNPSITQIDTISTVNETRDKSPVNTLGLTLSQRGRSRSKSPIWIPGESASYSAVLRGMSQSNSRAPSLEDITSEHAEIPKKQFIQTFTTRTSSSSKEADKNVNKHLKLNQKITNIESGKNRKKINQQKQSDLSSKKERVWRKETDALQSQINVRELSDMNKSGLNNSESIPFLSKEKQTTKETSKKELEEVVYEKIEIQKSTSSLGSNVKDSAINLSDNLKKDISSEEVATLSLVETLSAVQNEDEHQETEQVSKRKKNKKRRGKTKVLPEEATDTTVELETQSEFKPNIVNIQENELKNTTTVEIGKLVTETKILSVKSEEEAVGKVDKSVIEFESSTFEMTNVDEVLQTVKNVQTIETEILPILGNESVEIYPESSKDNVNPKYKKKTGKKYKSGINDDEPEKFHEEEIIMKEPVTDLTDKAKNEDNEEKKGAKKEKASLQKERTADSLRTTVKQISERKDPTDMEVKTEISKDCKVDKTNIVVEKEKILEKKKVGKKKSKQIKEGRGYEGSFVMPQQKEIREENYKIEKIQQEPKSQGSFDKDRDNSVSKYDKALSLQEQTDISKECIPFTSKEGDKKLEDIKKKGKIIENVATSVDLMHSENTEMALEEKSHAMNNKLSSVETEMNRMIHSEAQESKDREIGDGQMTEDIQNVPSIKESSLIHDYVNPENKAAENKQQIYGKEKLLKGKKKLAEVSSLSFKNPRSDNIKIEEISCTCLSTEQLTEINPNKEITQLPSTSHQEVVVTSKSKGKKKKKELKLKPTTDLQSCIPDHKKTEIIKEKINKFDSFTEAGATSLSGENIAEISEKLPTENITDSSFPTYDTFEKILPNADITLDLTRSFLLGEQLQYDSNKQMKIQQYLPSSSSADKTIEVLEEANIFEDSTDQNNSSFIEPLLINENDNISTQLSHDSQKEGVCVTLPESDRKKQTEISEVPDEHKFEIKHEIEAAVEETFSKELDGTLIESEKLEKERTLPWVNEIMEITLKNIDDTTSVLTMYKKTENLERKERLESRETGQPLEAETTSLTGDEPLTKFSRDFYPDFKYSRIKHNFGQQLSTEKYLSESVFEKSGSIIAKDPEAIGQIFPEIDKPVKDLSQVIEFSETNFTPIEEIKRKISTTTYHTIVSKVQEDPNQTLDDSQSNVTITEVETSSEDKEFSPYNTEFKINEAESTIFDDYNISEQTVETGTPVLETVTVEFPTEVRKDKEKTMKSKNKSKVLEKMPKSATEITAEIDISNPVDIKEISGYSVEQKTVIPAATVASDSFTPNKTNITSTNKNTSNKKKVDQQNVPSNTLEEDQCSSNMVLPTYSSAKPSEVSSTLYFSSAPEIENVSKEESCEIVNEMASINANKKFTEISDIIPENLETLDTPTDEKSTREVTELEKVKLLEAKKSRKRVKAKNKTKINDGLSESNKEISSGLTENQSDYALEITNLIHFESTIEKRELPSEKSDKTESSLDGNVTNCFNKEELEFSHSELLPTQTVFVQPCQMLSNSDTVQSEHVENTGLQIEEKRFIEKPTTASEKEEQVRSSEELFSKEAALISQNETICEVSEKTKPLSDRCIQERNKTETPSLTDNEELIITRISEDKKSTISSTHKSTIIDKGFHLPEEKKKKKKKRNSKDKSEDENLSNVSFVKSENPSQENKSASELSLPDKEVQSPIKSEIETMFQDEEVIVGVKTPAISADISAFDETSQEKTVVVFTEEINTKLPERTEQMYPEEHRSSQDENAITKTLLPSELIEEKFAPTGQEHSVESITCEAFVDKSNISKKKGRGKGRKAVADKPFALSKKQDLLANKSKLENVLEDKLSSLTEPEVILPSTVQTEGLVPLPESIVATSTSSEFELLPVHEIEKSTPKISEKVSQKFKTKGKKKKNQTEVDQTFGEFETTLFSDNKSERTSLSELSPTNDQLSPISLEITKNVEILIKQEQLLIKSAKDEAKIESIEPVSVVVLGEDESFLESRDTTKVLHSGKHSHEIALPTMENKEEIETNKNKKKKKQKLDKSEKITKADVTETEEKVYFQENIVEPPKIASLQEAPVTSDTTEPLTNLLESTGATVETEIEKLLLQSEMSYVSPAALPNNDNIILDISDIEKNTLPGKGDICITRVFLTEETYAPLATSACIEHDFDQSDPSSEEMQIEPLLNVDIVEQKSEQPEKIDDVQVTKTVLTSKLSGKRKKKKDKAKSVTLKSEIPSPADAPESLQSIPDPELTPPSPTKAENIEFNLGTEQSVLSSNIAGSLVNVEKTTPPKTIEKICEIVKLEETTPMKEQMEPFKGGKKKKNKNRKIEPSETKEKLDIFSSVSEKPETHEVLIEKEISTVSSDIKQVLPLNDTNVTSSNRQEGTLSTLETGIIQPLEEILFENPEDSNKSIEQPSQSGISSNLLGKTSNLESLSSVKKKNKKKRTKPENREIDENKVSIKFSSTDDNQSENIVYVSPANSSEIVSATFQLSKSEVLPLSSKDGAEIHPALIKDKKVPSTEIVETAKGKLKSKKIKGKSKQISSAEKPKLEEKSEACVQIQDISSEDLFTKSKIHREKDISFTELIQKQLPRPYSAVKSMENESEKSKDDLLDNLIQSLTENLSGKCCPIQAIKPYEPSPSETLIKIDKFPLVAKEEIDSVNEVPDLVTLDSSKEQGKLHPNISHYERAFRVTYAEVTKRSREPSLVRESVNEVPICKDEDVEKVVAEDKLEVKSMPTEELISNVANKLGKLDKFRGKEQTSDFLVTECPKTTLTPLTETYAQVVKRSREPSPVPFTTNTRSVFDNDSKAQDKFETFVIVRPISNKEISSKIENIHLPPCSDSLWAEPEVELTSRTNQDHPSPLPLPLQTSGMDNQEIMSKEESHELPEKEVQVKEEIEPEEPEEKVPEEPEEMIPEEPEEKIPEELEQKIPEEPEEKIPEEPKEKVELTETEISKTQVTEDITIEDSTKEETKESSSAPVKVEVKIEKEVIVQSYVEENADNTLDDISQRSEVIELLSDVSMPTDLMETSIVEESENKDKDIKEVIKLKKLEKVEKEQPQEEISDYFIEEISESADETIKDSMDSLLPRDDETLGNIQVEVGISDMTDQTMTQSADIEINAEIAFSETMSNTLSKLDDDDKMTPPVGGEQLTKGVQKFISEKSSVTTSPEIKNVRAQPSHQVESNVTTSKKVEIEESVSKRSRKKLKKEPKIEVLSPKKETELPVQVERMSSLEDELQIGVSKSEVILPDTQQIENVQVMAESTQRTVLHSTVLRQRTVKKTIKKVIYVDGKEQTCTEVIEEPYSVETTEDEVPEIYVSVQGNIIVDPNNQSGSITEIVEMPVESDELATEDYPQYIVDESKETTPKREQPVSSEEPFDEDRNFIITSISESVEPPKETSVVYTISGEQQQQLDEGGILTTSQQTIIQQRTIVKRIVRRVVVINGIEHIHEESFEEPQMLDAVTSPGVSIDLPSLTGQAEDILPLVEDVQETVVKIKSPVDEMKLLPRPDEAITFERIITQSEDEPEFVEVSKDDSIIQQESQPELCVTEKTITRSFIEIESQGISESINDIEIADKSESLIPKTKPEKKKVLMEKKEKISHAVLNKPGKTSKTQIEVAPSPHSVKEKQILPDEQQEKLAPSKLVSTSETSEVAVKKPDKLTKKQILRDEQQEKLALSKLVSTSETSEVEVKKPDKLTKKQPKKSKKSKMTTERVSDLVESVPEREPPVEIVEDSTSDINVSATIDVTTTSPPSTPKSKKKGKKHKSLFSVPDKVESIPKSKTFEVPPAVKEETVTTLGREFEKQETSVMKEEGIITPLSTSDIVTSDPYVIVETSQIPVRDSEDIKHDSETVHSERTISLKEEKPLQEVEIVAEEVCVSLDVGDTMEESVSEQNTAESVGVTGEIELPIQEEVKGILEDISKQSSTEIVVPEQEVEKDSHRDEAVIESVSLRETLERQLEIEPKSEDMVSVKDKKDKQKKKKEKRSKKPSKRSSDEDINISINTTIASDKFQATSKMEVVQEYPVTANITGGLLVAEIDSESSQNVNLPEHVISYEVKIGEDSESLEKTPSTEEGASETISNFSYETEIVSSRSADSTGTLESPTNYEENNDINYDIDSNGNQVDEIICGDKVDDLAVKESISTVETEVIAPVKVSKDKLIVEIKDILTNPNTPSFKVLLREPNNVIKLKELQSNLNKLSSCKTEEKEMIIISTITIITECLETITYIIVNNKKFNDDISPSLKLPQLIELTKELSSYKKALLTLESEPAADADLVNAANSQIKAVEKILNESKIFLETDLQRWDEFLNGVNNISVLLQELAEDIESLEKEPGLTTEEKLNRLDELESTNNDYSLQMTNLITLGRSLSRPPARVLPQDLITAAQLVSSNDEAAAVLRAQLEQCKALAQEYRDTLVELQHVTKLAQAIVESRVVVNSLQHLQDEMQKDRKFFVSLSHCRSILESLEQHLDSETQQRHAELHSHLHNLASEILEKAGDRTGRLALAASRWTILEQGLAEETKWLHVALQRAPNLSGVSSADYEQYLSLYQALSTDISLHSGCVWKLLNTAHSLQSVICCTGLEESCDNLRYTMAQLQDKVNDDINKLLAFREIWCSFEHFANKLENWLKSVKKDKKLRKQPLDLRRFWELKAEYEFYKQIEADCGVKFETAMTTLPVSDEMSQRHLMSQLHERWSSVEDLLSGVEAGMISSFEPPSGCTTAQRLALLERRLADMESALVDSQGVIKTDEQLQVYLGRLKVVKSGVTEIQEDLLRLGMVHGTNERAKVTELQAIARRLESAVSNELQGVLALSDRLATLKKGLTRAARDQDRAAAVLNQCSACLDMEYGDVRQALVNSKGVVKALSEHWNDLMSLRQLLHSIPLGVKVSVSPIQCERDISRLQDTHSALEARAAALVSALLARTGLWDEFHGQLDAVRHSVREADYMMEMLQVQGPVDYHRLVKATDRLKGVRETLETRETGLEELRASGRRLEEVVKEEVAVKLRAEVKAEELAFRNTQAELEQLVTRYDKAVSLWSTYNKAKDQVLLEQQLTPEEWEEKKEHLDELARLAAEISHQVGVEVLRPEVDSLSKRLKDAQEALQSIDELQSSLTAVPVSGQHPQIILDAIQQSLKKQEGSPTEQLVLLRDHLIALGKAEPHINNISKESAETLKKTSDEETSVLQLLQLWEKIFRETFQEYHRLSSRLVHTEESNTVLKLWQEYLTHVNQFLDSEPPQHYHELSEQVQLCQVHHNVLSCQKSLVPMRKGGMDDAVIQQFNLLTNVHNETLAKIMEKQAQIQDRIKAWEKYRKDQAELLSWLKDAENDRNKLKLHYVSAKSVPKTLTLIEDLLKKLNEGEEMEKILNLELTAILKFCDDNLKNSLSIEHSSIAHRLSNLQAALQTWKDYLVRVKQGVDNYECQMNKIQNIVKGIQNTLKEDSESPIILIPYIQLKDRLEKLEEVSKSVDDLSGEIKQLEDVRDIVKDSLSPTEVKVMSQRCWLISQQQCDISHQLAMAILALEDRLQLAKLFDKRLEKLLTWAGDVESRLERMTSQGFADAGQALRRLETEIQAETSVRKREVDWLNKTGEELLAVEELGSERARQLENDLARLKEIWGSVLANTDSRAAKLRAIIQGISDLDTQIEELRIWLQEIETKLSEPIVIKSAHKDHIDQLLKELDVVQTEIEKQSTRIGDVLNLCELLLSDCSSCHITLDNESIYLAMTNLEKRWKMICVNSAERKRAICNLWADIQEILKKFKKERKWLKEIGKQLDVKENQLEENCYIENVSQISKEFSNLETELKQGINDRLVPLDSMYRHLLRQHTLPDEVAGLPEELVEEADALLIHISDCSQNALNRVTQLERFKKDQAKALTVMAKCNGLLTMAQLDVDSGIIPSDIETSIQKIEYELKEEAGTLSEADASGLEVMKWTYEKDRTKIQTMIDEYQDLWSDINRRLVMLKNSVILPKQMADRGVEVNTLKFEMDRSTQVDTLGWSSPMLRKDAYISELEKTCTEFEMLLITLQKLEQLDTHQKISKCIGQCVSFFELAQHLSQNLKEQCAATDDEALVTKLKSLGEQFAKVKQQAQMKLQELRETSAHGKLSCPLCSNKNWQQLDNDLWRLEQWLQYAEGTLSSQPSNPPSSIEQLEDAIQDQRELLLDLDSHRSLVVSMNIVGTHLAEHSDSEERAQELRTRLARDNGKWVQVCEDAAAWQAKLQLALMENKEFHETIEEMTEWIEKTEVTVRQSEPIDLNEPSHLIQAKYDKFKELSHELERCEPRIVSLEEAARQVLSHQQEENQSANQCRQRLTTLRLRLQSLSRLTALYMGRLAGGTTTHGTDRLPSLVTLSEQLLDSTTHGFDEEKNGNEVDTGTLMRCHRFFGRVMRASVPISAFLLLLLGAATLLPTTQHDFSCTNNILYNLVPKLRYPNGHPPI